MSQPHHRITAPLKKPAGRRRASGTGRRKAAGPAKTAHRKPSGRRAAIRATGRRAARRSRRSDTGAAPASLVAVGLLALGLASGTVASAAAQPVPPTALAGSPVTVQQAAVTAAATEVVFDRSGTRTRIDPELRLREVVLAQAKKKQEEERAAEEALTEAEEALAEKLAGLRDGDTEVAGSLADPLAEMVKTSSFGIRVNPITGSQGEVHTGQDYSAACGTEIYAAAAGTVGFAEMQAISGNRVEIDHGNGLETSYGHLSKFAVEPGDKLKRGDLVGYVGTTGNSTGCHLHFEVILDGAKIEPTAWLHQ